MILKASECKQRKMPHLISNARNRGSDFFSYFYTVDYTQNSRWQNCILKLDQGVIRSGALNSSCDIWWHMLENILNLGLLYAYICTLINRVLEAMFKFEEETKGTCKCSSQYWRFLLECNLRGNIHKRQEGKHTHTDIKTSNKLRLSGICKKICFYRFF